MCGDHHKVIDDKANPEAYTVEWLRDIKAQHEAQYAGGPEPGDEVVAVLGSTAR